MNQTILLIGGSYGIGKTIAEILAKNYQVIVASRSTTVFDSENTKHILFDATKDDISELDLPEVLYGFAYCPGSINLRLLKIYESKPLKRIFSLTLWLW